MISGKKFQSDLLIAIAVLTYTVTLSLFMIAKHNSFSTYAWDLGIFNQGFWTTVFQDKVFQYTCERHLVESGSFFGIHFSPILFLLLPIYYLFPYSTTMLVVQSLIIGLSAVPVYKTAGRLFSSQQSVLLASLYLLNPALHGVNCYDFHVQAFLPLVLNYLIYYTVSENGSGIIATANIALAVQEQVFYLILAYAGYLFIRYAFEKRLKRKQVLLIGVILVSAVSWNLTASRVIAFYNPEIPDHLKAGQHFAVLGTDAPTKIPIHVILHPESAVRALIFEWYDKLIYLLAHITPYLFIVSQSLQLFIPTLPWIAISLLSNYPPYYRLGFQYSAYLVPFIYGGFILGLRKESDTSIDFFKRRKIRLISVLIIATSLALSPLSPLTKGFYLSPAYQKPNPDIRAQRIHEIVQMIPQDASILTQDNLFPHVCGRGEAYVMVPATFRDVKTWKSAITWITTRNTEYILMDFETDPHGTCKYLLDIARRESYGLVSFYDNVYLYQRGFQGKPIQYEMVNLTYPVSELVPQNMVSVPEANTTFGYVYKYKNTTIPSRTLWNGPYEVMPVGNYTVEFNLKTTDNRTSERIHVDVFANMTILNTMVFTENELQNDTWTSLGTQL